MNTKEIQALKEFQRALLSVNNSLSKLGVELESVALTISQHQVTKIKDQLDRQECGASKCLTARLKASEITFSACS